MHDFKLNKLNLKGQSLLVTGGMVEAGRLGSKLADMYLKVKRDGARDLFKAKEGGSERPVFINTYKFALMCSMIRRFEESGEMAYQNVNEVKISAQTHGEITFAQTEKELASCKARPSIWAVLDTKAGDPLEWGMVF